jgi:hypothetical protein
VVLVVLVVVVLVVVVLVVVVVVVVVATTVVVVVFRPPPPPPLPESRAAATGPATANDPTSTAATSTLHVRRPDGVRSGFGESFVAVLMGYSKPVDADGPPPPTRRV